MAASRKSDQPGAQPSKRRSHNAPTLPPGAPKKGPQAASDVDLDSAPPASRFMPRRHDDESVHATRDMPTSRPPAGHQAVPSMSADSRWAIAPPPPSNKAPISPHAPSSKLGLPEHSLPSLGPISEPEFAADDLDELTPLDTRIPHGAAPSIEVPSAPVAPSQAAIVIGPEEGLTSSKGPSSRPSSIRRIEPADSDRATLPPQDEEPGSGERIIRGRETLPAPENHDSRFRK